MEPLDAESRYLADLVRTEMDKGVTARAIAEAATKAGKGISHVAVLNLRNGLSGAGNKLRKALCAYFSLTAGQLEQRALEWAKANPVHQEPTRVEYPDRYPERAAAAEAARAMGLPPDVVQRVLGWQMKAGESMSRWDWLEEFRSEARRAERIAVDPGIVAREHAEATAFTSDLLEQEKRLKAEREAAMKAATKPKK